MSCEVMFVGGPMDQGGKVYAVPADDDGAPPPEAKCEYLTNWGPGVFKKSPNEQVFVTTFRYVRQVNPMDDGPAWMYVPAPEFADKPDPLRLDDPEAWKGPLLMYEQFQEQTWKTRPPREPR